MTKQLLLATSMFLLPTLCAVQAPAEETHPVSVRALAFSPDGQRLAVGFGTREAAGGLLIWDVQRHTAARVVREHGSVAGAAFSPDGKLLAISIYDNSPKILDGDSLDVRATLGATHRGPLAFSSDGRFLATGCEDRSIRLWDVARQTDMEVLAGHKDRPYTLAFSADGRMLVSAARDGVLLWDVVNGEIKRDFKHGGFLTSCAIFSPDGRRVITGGWDGTVRLWDSESGALVARLKGRGGVDRIAFAPAVNVLALHGTGRLLHLYDLSFDPPPPPTARRIADLLVRLDDDDYEAREAASGELVKLGLVAEPELARAAAASESAEVRIRARRAREALLSQPQTTLDGLRGRLRMLAFSPDGTRLASGGDDGCVCIWDAASGREVVRFIPADLLVR